MDFENMWKLSILNGNREPHFKMTLTIIRIPVFALLLSATCLTAQITPAPVPYASVSELNGILGPLEQASQSTQADLTKLRIDKWKMDSTYKKQVLGNTESVKRNLQSALPEIITQLRNSPEDLSATFKLYRNLDALYDVLGSIAESAGWGFGPDDLRLLWNAHPNLRTAIEARVAALKAVDDDLDAS